MSIRDFNVLIKPASSLCDLNCTYCFYQDEARHREIFSHGRMTKETAHALIERTLSHARRSCTFLFQGGEPTLTGLAFYRDFVSEVQRQHQGRLIIHYALQTNGQSIDREWAEFFREHGFLIGVSLDGTAEIHDLLRGEGTHKKVMRSLSLLTACHVDYNILTVVTARTARNTEAVYRFFKKQGFLNQQYIPCLDGMDGEGFLSAKEYGRFLVKLFRLWERDAVSPSPVSIRYFDELVLMLLGNRPGSCGMSGVCGLQYAVEANGDVYPCDFYCLDGYRLGNVMCDSFEAMDAKREEIGFFEASKQIHEECRVCPYFALCRGGCRRERDCFHGEELTKNRLCEGYRMFFSECGNDLIALARRFALRSGL